MLEILTNVLPILGGGLFGALMTLWGNAQKDRAEAHKQTMEALSQKENSTQNRNEYAEKNKGFAITRRIIVVSVLSVLIGAFWVSGEVTVPVTITEGGSYLFGFIDTTTTKEIYKEVKAPLVLPEVLQSFQFIIGTYFGHGSVKR